MSYIYIYERVTCSKNGIDGFAMHMTNMIINLDTEKRNGEWWHDTGLKLCKRFNRCNNPFRKVHWAPKIMEYHTPGAISKLQIQQIFPYIMFHIAWSPNYIPTSSFDDIWIHQPARFRVAVVQLTECCVNYNSKCITMSQQLIARLFKLEILQYCTKL